MESVTEGNSMGSGVVMTVVVREELKLKVVGKEDDCEG